MYFVVTLALKILIYASVNCGFSGFAAPRLSEGRGCLQTMPSVSGEKELKPKTTSFYSTSSVAIIIELLVYLYIELNLLFGVKIELDS